MSAIIYISRYVPHFFLLHLPPQLFSELGSHDMGTGIADGDSVEKIFEVSMKSAGALSWLKNNLRDSTKMEDGNK